jgi:hypothetical protein
MVTENMVLNSNLDASDLKQGMHLARVRGFMDNHKDESWHRRNGIFA